MAEKTCNGECLTCGLPQQIYCAAQHGHALMLNQQAIVARLERIEQVLGALGPKDIINPLEGGKAQQGAGAENRATRTTKQKE